MSTMTFSALATTLLLLVASASAQISALPDCALGCAEEAATQAQCALTDNACLCANTSFAPSVIQCAGQTSCSPELQTQISDIIQQMCALASGSASASGASTSGTGTVSVSVSPPGGSTVSPSGSGSVTIVPPPISLSSSALPSSTSSGSASASVTASASTSSAAPSTSPSTGTAHRNQMRGAGVVGALFVVAVGIL
ncbi:hypothetical protein B0H13DRAFT_705545 [Mycena leptocephala]|nr:hypothetical protein B0H13DRAFT_705545 [Mycena leptocephala]